MLQDLDSALVNSICGHLPATDLCSFGASSRGLLSVVHEADEVWEHLVKRDFGPDALTCKAWLRGAEPVADECAAGDCSEYGKYRCSRCKAARFCSRECQKRGWKAHKPRCQPGVAAPIAFAATFEAAATWHKYGILATARRRAAADITILQADLRSIRPDELGMHTLVCPSHRSLRPYGPAAETMQDMAGDALAGLATGEPVI